MLTGEALDSLPPEEETFKERSGSACDLVCPTKLQMGSIKNYVKCGLCIDICISIVYNKYITVCSIPLMMNGYCKGIFKNTNVNGTVHSVIPLRCDRNGRTREKKMRMAASFDMNAAQMDCGGCF